MKKLIKNFFNTFLGNKIAMIVLIFIIFISSTIYTILDSTSNSFTQSYNDVVETGSLHNFTIKEKYDITGNVDFKPTKAKHEIYTNLNLNTLKQSKYVEVVDDNNDSIPEHVYLYFINDPLDLFSAHQYLYDKSKNKLPASIDNIKPTFRIDIKDLKVDGDTKRKVITKIKSGSISIEFYSTSNTGTFTPAELGTSHQKTNTLISLLKDGSTINDLNALKTSNNWVNFASYNALSQNRHVIIHNSEEPKKDPFFSFFGSKGHFGFEYDLTQEKSSLSFINFIHKNLNILDIPTNVDLFDKNMVDYDPQASFILNYNDNEKEFVDQNNNHYYVMKKNNKVYLYGININLSNDKNPFAFKQITDFKTSGQDNIDSTDLTNANFNNPKSTTFKNNDNDNKVMKLVNGKFVDATQNTIDNPSPKTFRMEIDVSKLSGISGEHNNLKDIIFGQEMNFEFLSDTATSNSDLGISDDHYENAFLSSKTTWNDIKNAPESNWFSSVDGQNPLSTSSYETAIHSQSKPQKIDDTSNYYYLRTSKLNQSKSFWDHNIGPNNYLQKSLYSLSTTKLLLDFNLFKNLLKEMHDSTNANLFKLIYSMKSHVKLDFNTLSGDYKHLVDQNKELLNLENNDILTFDGIMPNANDANSFTYINYNDSIAFNNAKKELLSKLKSLINKNKSSEFINNITNVYDDVKLEFINSITVNDNNQQVKVVKTSNNRELDKLVLFSGSKLPEPETQEQIKKKLEENAANNGWTNIGFIPRPEPVYDFSQKFKGVMSWTTPLLNLGSAQYIDKSSYFAVVSPMYAQINNIVPISFDDFKSRDLESLMKSPIFLQKYRNNIVNVSSVPYLVVGIGTTPDFAFPIIDRGYPVPNFQKQAILFTNTSGYERMNNAFRGNGHENYIAGRFNTNVSQEEINNRISKLEAIAKKDMNWPANIQIVSDKVDTIHEKVLLVPNRVTFLTSLNSSIKTVIYITTSMLIILSSFIVLMVVKREIAEQRRFLATLLANGYSKSQISLATTIISLMVAFIPSILGYISGYFLQFWFIDIFSNSWSLPVHNYRFSWLSLSLTVILPILGVFLISYLITLWELRGNVVDLLKDAETRFASKMSANAMGMFAWLGIKTKLSLSLFFSNMSKMFTILLTTGVAVISISIGFTMIGKFDSALQNSRQYNNYKYKVNLVSPTKEGGEYKIIMPDRVGAMGLSLNNMKDLYRTDIMNAPISKPTFYKSFFLLPSQRDQYFENGYDDPTKNNKSYKIDYIQKYKLYNFLKHRVSIKPLLDANIGALGVSNNPWEFVTNSIPENQMHSIDNATSKFFEYGISLPENKKYILEPWYPKKDIDGLVKPDTNYITEPFNNNVSNPVISKKYRMFVLNILKHFDDEPNKSNPYFMSYGDIFTDFDDQYYTYMNANFIDNSSNYELNITGIDQTNHSYYTIPDSKLDKLDLSYFKDKNVIPIIANAYFLNRHNKSIGDEFTMDITNDVNRIARKFNKTDNNIKFKIIDSIDTYDGDELITTRIIANNVLGMSTWGFNGVYTNHNSPRILSTLSLYSQSGIYIPSSAIDETDQSSGPYTFIEAAIDDHALPSYINNVSDYVNAYSNSAYVLSNYDVTQSEITNYVFKNTLDLSSKIIWIIEGIAITISFLFVFIMATMMLSANKKNISTLKVMGYRNKEIRWIFIRTNFLPMLLATLFSIPIVFGLLIAIEHLIMNFGSILIPMNMRGYEIVTAMLISFTVTLLTYAIAIFKLRNMEVLLTFGKV